MSLQNEMSTFLGRFPCQKVLRFTLIRTGRVTNALTQKISNQRANLSIKGIQPASQMMKADVFKEETEEGLQETLFLLIIPSVVLIPDSRYKEAEISFY